MTNIDQSDHKAALRNMLAFAMSSALVVLFVIAIVALRPPQFAHPSQAQALSPIIVVPILLLALSGIYLSVRTRMTADAMVGAFTRRFIVHAVGGGLLLGLLTVAADHLSGFSIAIANTLQIKSIHIGFPESAYVYAAGAIIVECLYRFIPVSILYALMLKLLRGRHEAAVFWTLGVLTAILEPLSQAPLAGRASGLVAPLFCLIYLFNLTEVWLWRNYGWIAPVVSRLAFYGVWHVAIGPVLTGTI